MADREPQVDLGNRILRGSGHRQHAEQLLLVGDGHGGQSPSALGQAPEALIFAHLTDVVDHQRFARATHCARDSLAHAQLATQDVGVSGKPYEAFTANPDCSRGE